jgi:peptidoglycan/LPS O-acetylase OafA/YrhL
LSRLRKYDFIDALRGWAIVGVVMVHASLMAKPASPLLAAIAGQGQRGVQLFFVASALTLFLSLQNRAKQEARPIRNYFIRRFFRIAPLFYLAIAFYTLSAHKDWASEWWQVVATAAFVHVWHPESINSVVPGGWTIGVEMTFYLLVPFLFLRLTTVPRTLWFILLTLALAAAMNSAAPLVLEGALPGVSQRSLDNFRYFWFFNQLPVFGFGILAFHWFQSTRGATDPRLGPVLLVVALLLCLALVRVETTADLLPQHVLYALAFCVFAMALRLDPHWLFVNPLIVWVGKVSFSIYLVHFALIRIPQFSLHNTFGLKGDFGFWVVFGALMTASFLIAQVSYRLIERPGVALGNYLIDGLERRASSRWAAAAA